MSEHQFKDNKYSKWYFKLMSKPFDSEGYSEKHHIIPKSMGGDNSKLNIVKLSGRQHFIAHKILCRMTDGIFRRKAEAAFRCIAIMKSPKANKKLIKLTSKDYEHIREEYSKNARIRALELWASPEFRLKMKTSQSKELRSERAKKGRTEEVIKMHRQSLKGRKHSEETKAKMRTARLKKFELDPEYRKKCAANLARGLETIRSRMTR